MFLKKLIFYKCGILVKFVMEKLLELFWLFKWNMIGVILLLNIIKLYDWMNFFIVLICVLSNNLL